MDQLLLVDLLRKKGGMLSVSGEVRISRRWKLRGGKSRADKSRIARDGKCYDGKVVRSTDELEMLQE